MTRLDPKGRDKEGAKIVTRLGPSIEEIRETMNTPTDEVELGPIQTAKSYGSRVQARRAATNKLKGKGRPLGGAPPIDMQKATAIANQMAPRPSFGEPEPDSADPQNYRVPKEPPQQSLGGVGAGYAINQQMAKGGVDRPVSMREAKEMARKVKKDAPSQLSQESIEALQRAQDQVEEENEEENEEGTEDETDEELEEATRRILERDPSFDYSSIAEQQQKLMSGDRKKSIESRLDELDIADMIVKKEIVQDIPVIPGKLIYTLRTFNQHEHLFCLNHVYEHTSSVSYAEEYLNTCKLVCSLVAINGARLPDHRVGIDTPQEAVGKKEFEKKMFHVAGFPTHLIADLSVQAIWFNQRVAKLFSVENLKNG